MDYTENKNIVKALIDGKIVVIDLADDNRDAYENIKDKIYLGYGTYYSINDVRQEGKLKCHFWKFGRA